MATAGSIVIDLLMKTGSFVTDTQRAEKSMKSMERTAAGVSKGIVAGFTAIGSVIGGALAAFASVDAAITGLSNAINAADRIDELSARFSISTETLSGWGYAAKMTGSDLESLVGIIPKFSKNIADASKAGSDADKTFKALGISVKDQAGNLRSFEDLLPEVQNRFAGISNETTKTALAMQLFGKSGAEFLEFLSLGADGMRSMEERARSLGIVIDSDTAGAAAEFNDRLDDLRAATQGWFTQLASELLPTLTDLTSQLVEVAKEGGGVRDVAHGIASAFREIGKAAEIFGVVENWLDRLRGGLVAVEKQGNAVIKLATGQYSGLFGSQGGGWDAFAKDYLAGTAYADRGWAAMQGGGSGIPDGARSGPRGRRTQATAEEIQATKDQTEQLRRAAEWESKLQATWAEGEKKRAAGASRQDKQAKKLQDSYRSTNDQLERQIALFGDSSELGRVNYEIQSGGLKGIDAAAQAAIRSSASLLDMLGNIDEAESIMAESAQKFADAFDGMFGIDDDSSSVVEDKFSQWTAYADQAARNMQDSFADFLFDPFADGLGGMAANFAKTLQKMAAQVAASKVFQLVGSWANGYTGAGSSWINALGGIIGGTSGGRAGGGPVAAGSMYRVGEGGRPELFDQGGKTYLIPGDAGSVRPITAGLPTSSVAGGGTSGNIFNTTLNVTSDGTSTSQQGAGAQGQQIQQAFSQMINQWAVQQSRDGGLLNRRGGR
ncbi:hypothetical protein DI041_04065 [Stenotrophomonas maltophilia]|uniref:hypothetical protein n=1 Tax=Stenotrophomonas maltophilia TaxID=40324 RepID=UPI0010AA1E4F|nr:hypothetical protein [Stenotrophomonas maltophilia]TIE20989.1 hypothetical protein DI034_02065 [Stenotrophomonas maltophilia]TIE64500.1 hypothetical protein DI041_04065 [Stenotrophomonas maltophilia]